VLPVIALVGRPNVGKSTLFNVLTRTRDALVADVPGLTRDRKYGYAHADGRRCVVIDTGGLVETTAGVERLMAEHQLRRIPIVDVEHRPLGLVSLANLALESIRPASHLKQGRVVHTLASIDRPRPSDEKAA